MSKEKKYIGIESRVSLDILDSALYDYISNGSLNKENCLLHIKQTTKGENRAKKILKHVTVFLNKNALIIEGIKAEIFQSGYYSLSDEDRKIIIMCLFCNSFPFAYDILVSVSKTLKVQNLISKETLYHKLATIYGGNRATDIGLTEIIPLLIEIGVIKRVKNGLYGKGEKLPVVQSLISELIYFTIINVSESNSILQNDIQFNPFMSYFKFETTSNSYNHFITKKESLTGGGYLFCRAI